MFGSKRNRELAARITEAVGPAVAKTRTTHGLPTGFWNDAYVLGFLMGQINGWMSIYGGDDLSVADRGRVLVETFGALSGQKGKPISENAMVHAQQESPDFMRANRNGMFMAMFAAERVPNADGIPAVAAARQEAGDDATHDAITDRLLLSLWIAEVRARMSVGA